MFYELIEEVRRDITGVLPQIAQRTISDMKYSGKYSRTQLRKLGILPNKWKKRDGKRRA